MVVPHADHRAAVAAVGVVVREYEDLKVALGLMRKDEKLAETYRDLVASNSDPKPMHIIDYFEKLQQCFIANARPENMAAMEAYMLNQFHFLGIKAPQRRALMKEVGLPKWSAEDVLQLARALWTLPYREYHYVAIDQLARHVKVLRTEHIATMFELAQST